MALSNHKVFCAFLFFAIILLLIKCFTAIIILKDDPTSFLIFQYSPTIENYFVKETIDENAYSIIASDENGLMGESAYRFITQYLWWIMFLMLPIVFYLEQKI